MEDLPQHGTIAVGGSADRASLQLDPDAASARDARVFVQRVCANMGIPNEVGDVVTLLTSEVVTNAVLHGRSSVIGLTVAVRPDIVLVEVSDDNARHPQIVEQDTEALDGRGLAIVDVLATAWGSRERPPGKVVWFEVPTA